MSSFRAVQLLLHLQAAHLQHMSKLGSPRLHVVIGLGRCEGIFSEQQAFWGHYSLHAPNDAGGAGCTCRSVESSALWRVSRSQQHVAAKLTLVSSRATTQRRSAPSTAAASASTAASACGGTNTSSVACTPAAGGPLAQAPLQGSQDARASF